MPSYTKVSSGDLRFEITWQKPSAAFVPPSLYGDPGQNNAINWVTVGVYYADVEPIIGRTQATANAAADGVTHQRVTMRNPGTGVPKAGDRFLFETDNRIFTVNRTYRVDNKEELLEIICTELETP